MRFLISLARVGPGVKYRGTLCTGGGGFLRLGCWAFLRTTSRFISVPPGLGRSFLGLSYSHWVRLPVEVMCEGAGVGFTLCAFYMHSHTNVCIIVTMLGNPAPAPAHLL